MVSGTNPSENPNAKVGIQGVWTADPHAILRRTPVFLRVVTEVFKKVFKKN